MTQLTLSDDSTIVIETMDNGGAVSALGISPEKPVIATLDSVSTKGAQFLRECVQRMRDGMKAVAPDELSIEVGISVSAEGSIVVTKGSAEANLKVTATWKRLGNQHAVSVAGQ